MSVLRAQGHSLNNFCVGSVLSGAELQPSGTKVVVPGSGVSAEGPRTLMEGVKTETCKVDGT